MTSRNRILARKDPSGFVGRERHIERLLAHSRRENGGLSLLAAPGAGCSELLRCTYDRLFTEQDDVIPFYFEIDGGGNAAGEAIRFVREFLLQSVAFRRRDPNIIDSSPEICEIAELALPEDGHWIDRLIETCHHDGKLNDARAVTRNCLSAPLRAAAAGARSFVMIDAVHETARLDGGEQFLDELLEIFGRSSVPFVLAGHRRFLFSRVPFDAMHLEALTFEESGKLAERLSAETGVAVNDQTRDLIAVQSGGIPADVHAVFGAADAELDSFDKVGRAYTQALLGGATGNRFEASLAQTLPAKSRTAILRLLQATAAARGANIPLAYWRKHSGLADNEFSKVIEGLHTREIINIGGGSVGIDASDLALSDYITSSARLEIDGVKRASAFGDALAANVKRAPRLMARFYRRNAALGLREMLSAFDGRNVSPAAVDYGQFRDQFKGADEEKTLKALKEDNETVTLPRIVFAAHTSAFYPKLNDLCDAERSCVAFGFEPPDDTETVWIAAEIDSKLEGNREVTEFWCDRLEMVALNSNFEKYRIWLVAPEGFDDEAMAVLSERGAYGSSRRQVELLRELLGANETKPGANTGDQYEIVVPMGNETEMIAAHAFEEIARRHGLPTKTINQIKTALVEACINAAEHSLSPDQRITQKFSIGDDRVTITISNRGVRLGDKIKTANLSEEGRRGWGLKLIKGLMDEVEVERTDDGTRITMVKYFVADAG